MNQLRLVDVYKCSIEHTKENNCIEHTGTFHQFIQLNDGEALYAAAIVELNNGTVITPWVGLIKFKQ